MKQQSQIDLKHFSSSSGFIHHYQTLIKDVVIPYQYAVLNDTVEGVEKSHVIANFENAAKALRGEDVGDGFYGMVFQDSDAAKWLEAAAYSLILFPDSDLERKADALIDKIADAQDTDGYLNTYYTIKDREKRWTNLQEGHELYCAGHMMEAAAAYYEATGKDRLLKVMQKNAAHIYKHFITEKHEGYPGHPEVELALLRMYHATGDTKCLELANHFIDVRGVDNKFFENESKNRGWYVWSSNPTDTDYTQASGPLRDQSDATGHSVRAVYLYTGMADLASLTDDDRLISACRRLWDSITKRRMYITGGIGSTANGEAFTVDYNLPNDTAYAETCASIGLMFFASKMLELDTDSEYADIMERAFYNTVLAGMQLDGKRFFYVNPLEVIPGVSGIAVTHRHALPQRPGWYACACCPPNVARLIASYGKYAYGENDDTAFCHLFAQGNVSFKNGLSLECKTDYPYGFTVKYSVLSGSGKIAIRRPGYCEKFDIRLNGTSLQEADKGTVFQIIKGYYIINVKSDDKLEVILDDRIKRLYCSSKVAANSGMTALQRGPLVYCAEGADNEDDVLSLVLADNGAVHSESYDPMLLGGTVKLQADGWRTGGDNELYTMQKLPRENCTITFIPYYTWGNRGLNQMRVWLPTS